MSTYVCELCAVQTGSAEDLRSHLRGRRHQHSLDLAAAAERSVYVRGFPPKEIEERAVQEAFEQFGAIKHVFFGGPQHRRLYAIVEFVQKGSALKALRHPEAVYLCGRKLVVKPREWKTPNRGQRKDRESGGTQEAAPPGNSPVPESIGGVRLQPETITELQETQSLVQQLEVLANHCRIPPSTVEAQFSLCHKLNSIFRETFPRCILVPFGAPISGHGTVTSDCDICLLTDPSEEDRRCFSREGYYSEEHLSMWERVTRNDSSPGREDVSEVDSQTLQRDCGEQDLDMSSDSTVSSSASPTMPTATHSKKTPHSCSPEFDVVLAIVHTIPACGKVLPIPFARCPIVRFYYEPSHLHCDLSINNRLGPCNTQLMRAYYDFNPCLSLLVPVVRIWARFIGLTRVSLNNYAVSLLLIYALQHTTPPVLPCLQNPGAWPRNMDWFAVRGFAATTGVSQGRITPGGWKCEFTAPSSLMPSQSTASVAELLLHFFQFYTEEFDFNVHVVAVHHRAPARLSKQEASSLAYRDESTPRRKQASLKITPICLQDPFELSHNVTKSLSKVAFFQDMLTAAKVILQEQLQLEKSVADPCNAGGNLFALFDQAQYQWVASRLPPREQRRSKYLMLTPTHVASLLQKVSVLRLLGERLGDLDLSNESLVQKLADVVMQALVAIMEEELKFTCEAVYSSEPSSVEHSSAMELGVESESSSATLQQVMMGETPQDITSGGDVEVEKMMDRPSTAEEDGGTRKRQRTEQHSEDTHPEEPKRAKLYPAPVALQLLCSAVRGTEAYSCTAHTNTWLHRRKAQREKHCQGEASITALSPPETPMLEFSLSSLKSASSELKSVRVPSETIIIIKLMLTQLQQTADFSTFFAFFKKLIMS